MLFFNPLSLLPAPSLPDESSLSAAGWHSCCLWEYPQTGSVLFHSVLPLLALSRDITQCGLLDHSLSRVKSSINVNDGLHQTDVSGLYCKSALLRCLPPLTGSPSHEQGELRFLCEASGLLCKPRPLCGSMLPLSGSHYPHTLEYVPLSLALSFSLQQISLKERLATKLATHCDVDQFSNTKVTSQFQEWGHFCIFIRPNIVILKSVLRCTGQ